LAYTIGASHGPFTGNGSFTIAKPNGIRSILSGIPSHTGHDGSIPRRYFKLGRMSLGNPHGFQFSHGLEYVEQLLYPVAPVWEILAYDIKDGASCTFYELIDVPDLTLKQPWDRTPLGVGSNFNVDLTALIAETTGLTYTVPTGRKLHVSNAELWVTSSVAQAAATRVYVILSMSGVRASTLWIYGPAPGQRYTSFLPAGGHILNAGQVLSVVYAATAALATLSLGAAFSGYLFDA